MYCTTGGHGGAEKTVTRALQEHQSIDPKSFDEFIRKPAHKSQGMTHL